MTILCDLYEQIVRLEFEVKRYAHFEGAEMGENSIPKKIASLNLINKNFQQFQHKFWEIEIILDDSTSKKIQEFLDLYIQITTKLSSSLMSQQLRSPKESFDSWNKSFEMISSSLVELKNELKENFKEVLN